MENINPKFKILIIFLLILFGILFFAKNSLAATINAASCSQADVSAAITTASREDTVIVPAGSCDWSDTLAITKGIILQGAGIDQTTITRLGTIISYVPDATAIANNELFKVTGFTFNGNGNTTPGMIRLTNSSASTLVTNISIGNNKFKNSTASALRPTGLFNGVFYENQLVDVGIVFGIFGRDQNSWDHRTLSYGTGDNFYVEDNIISFSQPSNYVGWTESGQGGRVVVRYNTWDSTNTIGSEYWDVHGLQTMPNCQQYSTMVAEYYGNRIINYVSAYRWILHRGSWLMMFNNAVTGGSAANLSVQIGQYSCDECAYGGEGYLQHVNNTYVWNNAVNTNRMNMYVPKESGYSADYCENNTYGFPKYAITENTDFWNFNTAFDGTAGIGCGPSAPTMNCTPGVGYWVTNAPSCSTPPSTMADMKTYTQAGKFYKCTSPNTWTLYYSPYTYPHPLRAEAAPPPDTTPPAAPTGVVVN